MPERKVRYISAWVLLCAVLAGAASAETPAARLTLAPCRLEHPFGLTSIAAECGLLQVPEDRANPAGRKLALAVARVSALSRRRVADPLFILAGGPGLGASTFYVSVAPAFERIRRDRDIILVDQRGTGKSNPLNCPVDEQQMWDASEEQTARVMRECRDRLAVDHDLAQYTTSVAVSDLEDVRTALGYGAINFYGSSYGTRVAQQYLRRYQAHTRAVILDGVVPPARILGTTTPLDAENSLQRIFARCRQDSLCSAAFGDPRLDYVDLRRKLALTDVAVSIADPRSGSPTRFNFSANVLAGALRLAEYSSDQAALLPLALHLANKQGQYTALASQFMLNAASLDSLLAYGMHNSVVCTEDVAYFDSAGIDRPALSKTFLGLTQIDALTALCRDWPRGPIDDAFHAPLSSDVPALILSGTADPVTPASYGDEAARGFKHALHLKFQDQGHGQLAQPCVNRLMMEFLVNARRGTTPKLDATCVARLRPAPFFLSANGPGP